MPRVPLILALALALTITGNSVGQTTTLSPVDQGIEDVSVLSVSLRRVDAGLHQPTDFSNVYRLNDQRLARAQGALYAVFDQSIYGANDQVLVPGGTVFYIGPLLDPKAPTVRRNDQRLDARLDLRLASGQVATVVSGQTPDRKRRLGESARTVPGRPDPPSMKLSFPGVVSDSDDRGKQIRELMRDAAGAYRRRSSH